MALCCTMGGPGWRAGKFSSQAEWKCIGTAAQGGGAATDPGGVQEVWRCSTGGRGQWSWGGVGWWLDQVVLAVFSSINDSMIL